MDLSLAENTLSQCIIFIEKEGYDINIQIRGKKSKYTLLYICHDTKICLMQKFDSIGDLHLQLKMNNQISQPVTIGIFDDEINKTSKYNYTFPTKLVNSIEKVKSNGEPS